MCWIMLSNALFASKIVSLAYMLITRNILSNYLLGISSVCNYRWTAIDLGIRAKYWPYV